MSEELGEGTSRLISLASVYDPVVTVDGRLRELVDEFHQTVMSRDFPCIFTWLPFSTGEVVFARLEWPEDRSARTRLQASVHAALRDLARRQVQCPDLMVVIFVDLVQSVVVSIEDDEELARDLVTYVRSREHDGADTDDANWELLVDGVGIFVNISTPRHVLRRSRNTGSAFTLIAQARASFDAKGRSAPGVRTAIRERIDRYDGLCAHSSLGSYGEPESREALQYFLGDTDQAINIAEQG